MIIPNSIFFPTNLNSFGYLESWHKTSEQNYIYNKGINSLCLNFELHSEKLREELKKAKELFESTYFVPNAYQENSLPKGTKIINDELIYNRLFYLIEETDLYLNNIRSTLINPKIRYNPGCFKIDLGYSHNVILYHLLINLRKTKSEFESSLKTIDTDGTTNNGFEVIYHNHLGKPFRKFKYVYDINLRLPLVNPELGYYVHRDGDNYVARKFMYWALTQQTIGEGSYPRDIFDGKDLFYYYSKNKVINLYPVYQEDFDGFIKINVYDADKNKVFETKIYKEFVKEHHYKYADNLIWQDIISYDEVKEAIRGIYCNYRYDGILCPKFCSLKYFFDVHYLSDKLRYLRSSISELDFTLIKYDDKYDEAKIKERLEPYRDSKVMFYNYESKLSNLIADFQFEIRFSQKTHDSSDYNYVFKEYIETWLLQSPYRHMIRELEFIETSSSFGMKYFHLYITFKRDNLLKDYPDYIDFTLSDIFGKDITNGRPLRIIANHNGNIPENPVVYKERLVFLRDNFQNILDTVIFVNYLSLNAGYPKQKFLEIKYKKEVVNSITELSSLIDDSGLDQKTVDRNAFMYEAIYRRILSNILDGIFNNHGGEVEDIDQSLLGKMRELLEKVQDFKKNVSTVPFEESTEIEICLHRNNLTELQDLEGAIIKSIDYFPFVTNNYPFKLINQKFYSEAKTKLEELQKNVRVNDSKIKALLEEIKSFNSSLAATNTLDKPYLLKRGIKYLLIEDYGRFTKAYSEVIALNETTDKINKGTYSFTTNFPGIKTVYETNYSIFQATKEKAVLGTWFHPDVTEIFKVKKQLEEIRDKVFIASKGDHYELKYPNYYLEYAVHHELIKDISEIESCLTNVQTLFQEDVDKIKNEKASKISTYDEAIFMGGDKLKLIFKGLESLKKEVQITLKTDPELLQKDQKYLVADSYRLLEEAVLNLKAKIETRKVDKKTIEADINKYQENLTALEKQVIIGRRLIGIIRLQDLLKRAQSLHTKVKIQGDSRLNSGDKYLQRTKYHNLENLIANLQKQTEDDFPTNDSFEKYYGSKEEELTNLEKSVLIFKKTNSVALMASLFTFLGIILIGLIVFPVVIKLKKDKKEKK